MTVVSSLPTRADPDKDGPENEADHTSAELLAVLMRCAQCDAATAARMVSSLQAQQAQARKAEKAKSRRERRFRKSPDFTDWAQARRSVITLAPFGDGGVHYYTCMADDAAQSAKKREAAMLISAAEAELEAGNGAEALGSARQAAEICVELGDSAAEADALRLAVHGCRLKAEMARWSPAEHGGEDAALRAAREAQELAELRLKSFKDRGEKRGVAAMLLSLAELDMDAASGASAVPEGAVEGATEACRLLREIRDSRLEAVALLTLARVQSRKYRWGDSRQAAEGAVALFQESGNKKMEAAALHCIAVVLALSHDQASGLQAARDALEVAREAGDLKAAAVELLTIGWLCLELEKPNEAIPAAQEAADTYRELDCPFGLGAIAEQIEVEALVMKDAADKAVDAASRAVARCQESGDKREEVYAQVTLAYARMCRGDGEGAAAPAEAALGLCRDIDDRAWGAKVQLTLAQVLFDAGDLPGAERNVQDAETFFMEDGDVHHEAVSATLWSSMLMEKGENERALQAAQRGQDLFREEEDKAQELVAVLQVAACKFYQGRVEDALAGIEEAQELSKETHSKKGEAATLSLAIDMHRLSGSTDKALQAAKEMRRVAQESGSRRLEASSLYHIARAHIDRGQGESKLAAKAADAATKAAQRSGHKTDQVYMLILAAEARLEVVRELSDNAGSERALRDNVTKCLQCIRDAVELSQRIGRVSLQALALYFQSVILLALGDAEGSIMTAQQARSMFTQAMDLSGEAYALTILSRGHHQREGGRDAAEASAKEAEEIFKRCGDEEGKGKIAQWLDVILPKQFALPPGGAPPPGRIRRVVKRLVKKQKQGFDPQMVARTVQSLATQAIGLEDMIFVDSPLMDSGMDSLTAVSFRNTLQQTLGVKISASLMFDYPTMKEVTNHIVEISGGDGGEDEWEEIEEIVEEDGPPQWPAPQAGAGALAAAPAVPPEPEKPKGLQRDMVMQMVQQLAQQAIGLDDAIFMDSPLMDSGMDSLTSVSFRNNLQTALGVKMPASIMFDYPTMQEITNKVVELSFEQ